MTVEVLQPKQIAAKCFPGVKVDIKGDEIEEAEVQILGWRVVGISNEAFRIDLLGRIAEFGQKTLDFARAVPADNGGRDLIGNAIGQHARIFSAALDRCAYGLPRRLLGHFAL